MNLFLTFLAADFAGFLAARFGFLACDAGFLLNFLLMLEQSPHVMPHVAWRSSNVYFEL
jgi:hypothetical protein